MINEKFDFYQKWFQTLLKKEFLNLPSNHQKQFMVMVDKFQKDCKKLFEEGKIIKERVIEITITRESHKDSREEGFYVYGKPGGEGMPEEIKIFYPISLPKPERGSTIEHHMYCLDGLNWYSTKTEAIEEANNVENN